MNNETGDEQCNRGWSMKQGMVNETGDEQCTE